MTRNLVLVTVDSLRADHCGFLGSSAGLTPTLDELAGDSVVFERAFSPGPRTPSSMPVVFTGEFAQRQNLGVYRNWEEKSSRWRERRARIGRHMARFRTIPEFLRDRGYHTGGVTANPWTTEATNFDAGFDEFRAVEGRTDGERSLVSSFRDRLESTLGVDWDGLLLTWTDYYDTVLEVRDALEEPYFLWVFLLDPHQPYIAPREYRAENTWLEMVYGNLRYNKRFTYTEELPAHLRRRLERAYRDSIRSVDGFVDRLAGDLTTDDPVTVVHSDHGEAFREHGTFGHRPQLYAENLHVPLLIHGLDRTDRVQQPVSLRRMPELLRAIGDSEIGFEPARVAEEFVLSKTEEAERVGLRNQDWSYLRSSETWDYVHGLEPEELYRLADDPGEQNNAVDRYPAVVNGLGDLLELHELHQRERDGVARGVEQIRERI